METKYPILSTIGYVLGALIPAVGCIIGIFLVCERDRHAWGVIITSFLSSLFWFTVYF